MNGTMALTHYTQRFRVLHKVLVYAVDAAVAAELLSSLGCWSLDKKFGSLRSLSLSLSPLSVARRLQ